MNSNILIKNIGKTLGTQIKYISVGHIKFYNRLDKEVSKKKDKAGNHISIYSVILGRYLVYIMDDKLESIVESFKYEYILNIEIDDSNLEAFSIVLTGELKKTSSKKIKIFNKSREVFIKSLMCYYSIYYMEKYTEITELKLSSINKNNKAVHIYEPGIKSFKQYYIKDYFFFLNYDPKDNYMNSTFYIDYSRCLEEKENISREGVYANGCKLVIDIDEVQNLGKFEVMKDEKDIAFHAYNNFIIYMRNTLKANKYWILRNNIFIKRNNFVEDLAQWEGWIIEARMKELLVIKNIIFIFLRRKFIPPYFSSFQNINIILTEDAPSDENYKINPRAYRIIELVANTFSYYIPINSKEYTHILKARVNSLLLDEDSFFYFENTLNIIGDDVYKIAFTFLYSILHFLERNVKQDKEKFDFIKQLLNMKVSKYQDNFDDFVLDHSILKQPKNLFHEIIKEFESLIKNQDSEEKGQNQNNLNKDEEETTKGKQDELDDSITPADEDELIESKRKENFLEEDKKQQEEEEKKKQKIQKEKKLQDMTWRSKILRFMSYCINGLTDFTMTFEDFIIYTSKCQSGSSDLNEFIQESLCILDLESLNHNIDDIKFLKCSYLTTLNEKSCISFNEESIASCIRQGYIMDQIDNIKSYPEFLKILLSKYCSNKILNALLGNLKSMIGQGEGLSSDVRGEFTKILALLANIYSDSRKCPITLTLACKCLCTLVIKEGDIKNKLILIAENVVPSIAKYIDNYDYDEKLLLNSLELFSYLLSEIKLLLNEYLFGEVNLINKLKKFISKPSIPGTFYSQKIILKILTIFLNLTKCIEANFKEKVISEHKDILKNLLILLDPDKRKSLIDETEEASYIVEFKIYYLLSILVYKNLEARNIIENNNIYDLLEKKAKEYLELVEFVLKTSKSKDKSFSEKKIDTIGKTILKYFEFTYYYMLGDNDEKDIIIKFKSNEYSSYNILRKLTEENRQILLLEDTFDVFHWIDRKYIECCNEETPY